jgi:hypothetical protein
MYHQSPSRGATATEGIMNVPSFYIFSGVATHMIYVLDMRLVDRNKVFSLYKHVVEAIIEDV